MKSFEEYLSGGIVRKITPDTQRAKNLYLESKRKLKQLEKTINRQGIDDENANDYVEYGYNIIMFFIRANMFERGYTGSGQGAHEAEVSFTESLGLSKEEVRFLDELRYFRNGILYYGKRFDKEYALKIIEFVKQTIKKIGK